MNSNRNSRINLESVLSNKMISRIKNEKIDPRSSEQIEDLKRIDV